jgi:hypothetical protein
MLNALSPLKHSGNYMYRLPYHSRTLQIPHTVYIYLCISCDSQDVIIAVNQMVFVSELQCFL